MKMVIREKLSMEFITNINRPIRKFETCCDSNNLKTTRKHTSSGKGGNRTQISEVFAIHVLVRVVDVYFNSKCRGTLVDKHRIIPIARWWLLAFWRTISLPPSCLSFCILWK
jgi:hypothetical protein